MHFKLICVLVDDLHTDEVLKAAREAGATGATVLSQARGEGAEKQKTFFGLALEAQRAGRSAADAIRLPNVPLEAHMSFLPRCCGRRKEKRQPPPLSDFFGSGGAFL